MTKRTLQATVLTALVAASLAACDSSGKKAAAIANDAVIQGGTAILSFTFDQVPQTKSDTEWIIPGFQKMPYHALMDHSKPIVLALYDLARLHPDMSQVVIKVACRRKGYTTEDQYGNRSQTPPGTTQEEPIIIDSEYLDEIRKYRDRKYYLTLERVADFAEQLGYRL